jgi:hypothetical protein
MFIAKWPGTAHGPAHLDIYADRGQLLGRTYFSERRSIAQQVGERIVADCRAGTLQWQMHSDSGEYQGVILGEGGHEVAATVKFDSEAEAREAVETLIKDAVETEPTFVMS